MRSSKSFENCKKTLYLLRSRSIIAVMFFICWKTIRLVLRSYRTYMAYRLISIEEVPAGAFFWNPFVYCCFRTFVWIKFQNLPTHAQPFLAVWVANPRASGSTTLENNKKQIFSNKVKLYKTHCKYWGSMQMEWSKILFCIDDRRAKPHLHEANTLFRGVEIAWHARVKICGS